ncbi:unnamed protein product, partial [Owenia fusiformis]
QVLDFPERKILRQNFVRDFGCNACVPVNFLANNEEIAAGHSRGRFISCRAYKWPVRSIPPKLKTLIYEACEIPDEFVDTGDDNNDVTSEVTEQVMHFLEREGVQWVRTWIERYQPLSSWSGDHVKDLRRKQRGSKRKQVAQPQACVDFASGSGLQSRCVDETVIEPEDGNKEASGSGLQSRCVEETVIEPEDGNKEDVATMAMAIIVSEQPVTNEDVNPYMAKICQDATVTDSRTPVGLGIFSNTRAAKPIQENKDRLWISKSDGDKRKDIINWVAGPIRLPDNRKLEVADLLAFRKISPRITSVFKLKNFRTLFTKAAWDRVAEFSKQISDGNNWYCGKCNKNVSKGPSIHCDGCLLWLHNKCANITKKSNVGKYFICEKCLQN